MATANIPSSAQLSHAAEYRQAIFAQAGSRLQNFAWRAVNVLGKSNTEVVIACIQVDSHWRSMVDELMPGQDWDAVRATGAEPIAQGLVNWALCRFIAKEFPPLATTALEMPTAGTFKVIVLSEEGCTIYEIEPKQLC